MPDDEPNPSSNESSDFDAGYSDSGAAPDFAPDHDSDQQNPKPGSDEQNQLITPKQMQDQMKAFQDGLNSVLTQQRANQADHFQMMRQVQALQQEANQPPPKPPVPYALPAPPDQQQKNTTAGLITNILKWGALIGLAYGTTRRSPIRGALFKTAMASALGSYHEGNNGNRNQALKLWEDNYKAIVESNKEQQRQYQDTIKNQHTTFQQKMDILKAQAQVWRNDRMQDAAISGNIMKVEQTYKDMVRMQHDWQKQMDTDRKEWYKLFGLSGKDGTEYRDWIISKGGPDPYGKSRDEVMKIEKDYPRSKMLTEHEQAEDQRKFELHKKEKEYDAQLQNNPPTDKGSDTDPNAPISDSKRKDMIDKIFIGSESD